MTDQSKPTAPEAETSAEQTETVRARRRPYEPPHCEKKRSIHRVTLLSGMGVMSMGALSMTG
jgi:hypothetical protein